MLYFHKLSLYRKESIKKMKFIFALPLLISIINAFVIQQQPPSVAFAAKGMNLHSEKKSSLDLRASAAILALVVSAPFIQAVDVNAAGYDMVTDMNVLSADKVEVEEKAAEAAVEKINAEEKAADEKKEAEEKAFKEKIAKSEVCNLVGFLM